MRPITVLRAAPGICCISLLLIGVQLYQTTLEPAARELFVLRWATIPMEVFEATDLEPTVPLPVSVTLLSGVFLHAGWLHLASNVVLLALFAPGLELAEGAWRTLGIFLLGGVAGGLAQIAANPLSLTPLLGASGGVAALMLARVLCSPTPRSLRLILVAWAAMQAAALVEAVLVRRWLGGGLAVWSHLGGLAIGAAAGLILRARHSPSG